MAYFISCQSCAFQEVVHEVQDVISSKEQHVAAYGPSHTLAVETVEEQPLFRGGGSDHW